MSYTINPEPARAFNNPLPFTEVLRPDGTRFDLFLNPDQAALVANELNGVLGNNEALRAGIELAAETIRYAKDELERVYAANDVLRTELASR